MGSSLTLFDSAIEQTKATSDQVWGIGAYVGRAGRLTLDSSTVDSSGEAHILADGTGTRVVARDGTELRGTVRMVRYTVSLGVVVQNDATFVGDELRVAESAGPGLLVTGSASASINDAVLETSSFAGIAVAGGSLDLAGGSISDTLADDNLGGGVGVFVADLTTSSSAMAIDGATIDNNIYGGVWVQDTSGSVEIGSSKITNSREVSLYEGVALSIHGNGVMAFGVLTGLVIDANEFEGNEGDHVLLDGSNATVTGNVYVPNGSEDVKQQACSSATTNVDLSADGAMTSDICSGSDFPATPLVFEMGLSEAAVTE